MIQNYLTGLQHIGIPTKDVDETIRFYEGLGFSTTYRLNNSEHNVAFLRLGDMVIETYAGDTLPQTGAIDHITINTTDVNKVHELAKAGGYKLLDAEVIKLPFFENGCAYFMIEGPNKERVEFNQIFS